MVSLVTVPLHSQLLYNGGAYVKVSSNRIKALATIDPQTKELFEGSILLVATDLEVKPLTQLYSHYELVWNGFEYVTKLILATHLTAA